MDVRDTADVVVALDRPGRPYLVPGETVDVPHQTLRTVTGHRLPVVCLPLEAMLPVLQLGYRTGWPFLPRSVEGARFIAINARVDYSATADELGVSGRLLARPEARSSWRTLPTGRCGKWTLPPRRVLEGGTGPSRGSPDDFELQIEIAPYHPPRSGDPEAGAIQVPHPTMGVNLWAVDGDSIH